MQIHCSTAAAVIGLVGGLRDFRVMSSYGDLSELSSINEQSNEFTKFLSLLPMSKPDYTFRKYTGQVTDQN
jgi:hypothetical protein